jgi:hypothetical protein
MDCALLIIFLDLNLKFNLKELMNDLHPRFLLRFYLIKSNLFKIHILTGCGGNYPYGIDE